jgi:hypothetical protein
MIRKFVLLAVIFFMTTGMINSPTTPDKKTIELPAFRPEFVLLYENIWGTIYHSESKQCDNTPTITGDGSRINPYKASDFRWIAISQEMLDDEYRANLVNPHCPRFKGKIEYGDTIWVDSPYKEINGWWVVHDTKNKRYNNSIDFLQTKSDGSLYNNNQLWNGKFDSIKIYQIKNYTYLDLQKSIS